MTQNRELVGRVARVPSLNEERIIISMDLIKIIPKEKINKNWIYSFFRFSGFGEKIKDFANGVNVLHLDPAVVVEQEIILPKKDLMDNFSDKISMIYTLIDNLELKNQNLRKTRDLLIPKLISGEVDVSDLDIKISEEVTNT
jgi:type I restriction enzyme, S subunit